MYPRQKGRKRTKVGGRESREKSEKGKEREERKSKGESVECFLAAGLLPQCSQPAESAQHRLNPAFLEHCSSCLTTDKTVRSAQSHTSKTRSGTQVFMVLKHKPSSSPPPVLLLGELIQAKFCFPNLSRSSQLTVATQSILQTNSQHNTILNIAHLTTVSSRGHRFVSENLTLKVFGKTLLVNPQPIENIYPYNFPFVSPSIYPSSYLTSKILGWPKSSFSWGICFSIKFFVKMKNSPFICT